MVALLDDLGVWNDLGTVFPTSDWQILPRQATEGFSVFRINWGGDLSDIKSQIQLRLIYNYSGFSSPDLQWIRLFPKQGSEILILNLPDELKARKISRGFQVMKWWKYLRNGLNSDSRYSLNIQEFQLLPQYLDNTSQQLEQIYQIVANLRLISTNPFSLLPVTFGDTLPSQVNSTITQSTSSSLFLF